MSTYRSCKMDYSERGRVTEIIEVKSVSTTEARYDFFSLRNIMRKKIGFNERGCEEELVKLGFDIPPQTTVYHGDKLAEGYEYCDFWHYQLDAIFRRQVNNDSANSIYVGTKDGIDYKKLKKQPNEWQRFFLEKWNEVLHPLADEHGWIKIVLSW